MQTGTREHGNTEEAATCLTGTTDEMLLSYKHDGRNAAVNLLPDSLTLEHKYLAI